MTAFIIILSIVLITGLVIDYRKLTNDNKRCPRCHQKGMRKYGSEPDDMLLSNSEPRKVHFRVYECPHCWFSWSQPYEYTEQKD